MAKYHFIGIKGSGMSALAQVVYDMGNEVQGTDQETYYFTQKKLEERNIPMYLYGAEHIKEGFNVVLGNAFDETHPEYVRAKELGLKTYTYAELLGEIIGENKSIAVTGAHGKTTTTTMMSNLFKNSYTTSYLIGDGTGIGHKTSDYFIAEACEYRRHFLHYKPNFAVVTNIDFDHPDYFKDEMDMFDAFQSFVNQVKDIVVYCGDDRLASKLTSNKAKLVSYGENEGNDYRIKNITTDEQFSTFDVYKKEVLLGTFNLPAFGPHNILNATSAIALADINGIEKEAIQKALLTYISADRRFTEHKLGDLVVVDDYAHHPREIKATIEGAKSKYPNKKVVAIFQPHTYSRTKQFLHEFAESLTYADSAFLVPIFSSVREQNDNSVKIEDLINLVPGADLVADEHDFNKLPTENAVLLFMGAGNINKLCDKFITTFQKKL